MGTFTDGYIDKLEEKNKMIIAMAIKKYNFEVNENAAVKEIKNDIEECGLSMSEDEILKNIRASHEQMKSTHEFKIFMREWNSKQQEKTDICRSEK